MHSTGGLLTDERRSNSWLQVLIRWNINMGNSAIPKASSKAHIEDNFKPVLDLALKDHHMHKLSTYKFQMRVLDGTGAGAFPPAGPYTTLQVRRLHTGTGWPVSLPASCRLWTAQALLTRVGLGHTACSCCLSKECSVVCAGLCMWLSLL